MRYRVHTIRFNTLLEFVKSFKCDNIHKFCILVSGEHTCLISCVIGPDSFHCGKLEKLLKAYSDLDLLILIGQCSLSKLSELFSYTTMYSNFMFIDRLLFELQTHTHTHRGIQGFRGGALGGCVLVIRGESYNHYFHSSGS